MSYRIEYQINISLYLHIDYDTNNVMYKIKQLLQNVNVSKMK